MLPHRLDVSVVKFDATTNINALVKVGALSDWDDRLVIERLQTSELLRANLVFASASEEVDGFEDCRLAALV